MKRGGYVFSVILSSIGLLQARSSMLSFESCDLILSTLGALRHF